MEFLFLKPLFSAIIISFLIFADDASNVTYDSRAILIDENRRILISGTINYPRSTVQVTKLFTFLNFKI